MVIGDNLWTPEPGTSRSYDACPRSLPSQSAMKVTSLAHWAFCPDKMFFELNERKALTIPLLVIA